MPFFILYSEGFGKIIILISSAALRASAYPTVKVSFFGVYPVRCKPFQEQI
jgi:hypothetical protein